MFWFSRLNSYPGPLQALSLTQLQSVPGPEFTLCNLEKCNKFLTSIYPSIMPLCSSLKSTIWLGFLRYLSSTSNEYAADSVKPISLNKLEDVSDRVMCPEYLIDIALERDESWSRKIVAKALCPSSERESINYSVNHGRSLGKLCAERKYRRTGI